MSKVLSSVAIRALALASYLAESAALGSTRLSPAKAIREIGSKAKRPVTSIVAAVYFEENGSRNPLAASAAKGEKSLARAIRTRRDAGGTLGRWESVKASANEALRLAGKTPITEARARVLYDLGGGDLDASYVGRGTRVAAPKTYADEVLPAADEKETAAAPVAA